MTNQVTGLFNSWGSVMRLNKICGILFFGSLVLSAVNPVAGSTPAGCGRNISVLFFFANNKVTKFAYCKV